MLHHTYISLGSNLGNTFKNLQDAINVLHKTIGNTVIISPVYETSSWGFEAPSFLNCCVGLTTSLTPNDLLGAFKEIEASFGRKKPKGDTYESRVLDIDILFYDSEIVNTPTLIIPHKHLTNRNFVLQPLSDIAPSLVHPVLGKSVSELLLGCADTAPVTKLPQQLKNPFNAQLFSLYNFIAIEGNIGSGKTSLATKIAEDYNAKLVLERFADNDFLPKFYKDQERFAFPLEMSFLADRYKQLSDDIAQYDLFTDFIVADYHVSKSLTFAKVTLPEDEYALYSKFFQVIYKDMQQPDLYVYLYQNTERLLQNIAKRGRDYEQDIQPEYLDKINKGYLSFIKSQPNLCVKVIDVSALDFVNNRADYLTVLTQICEL